MNEFVPFGERSSGILLHPTSLPGPYGLGDLGPSAYGFVDFLRQAGQRWWQMLPVGPPGGGNSPYDSPSAFAGSPLLVSLELLERERLLDASEIEPPARLASAKRAHYEASARFRLVRLRKAFERFEGRRAPRDLIRGFEAFRANAANWLSDFALFSALAGAHRDVAWTDWDVELVRRRKPALLRAERELGREIRFQEFLQYLFATQWSELKRYANERGILLLGDVPMFVAHNGADVWSHQELFHLDRAGHKTVVAGVPPDPFAKKGQLWGNALYRWPVLASSGYAWWIERFRTSLERFDALRLDHFIGFYRCWEVRAGARNALKGRFVLVPGEDLLRRVRRALGSLPFVAEDLGLVTAEVRALRDRFELPGMAVLQFGFGDGGGGREHEPHNYVRKLLAYTGTHDNDTFVGWFRSKPSRNASRKEAQVLERVRTRVRTYLGGNPKDIHWQAVRALLVSVADTTIFPLQDLLGLGSEARMNVPGIATGNWTFRADEQQLEPAIAERMRALCEVSRRITNSSTDHRTRNSRKPA